MTAPIQEPSVYRTQSGHSWGISQLARRPANSGGATPWARRKLTTDQTIPTASDTAVDFDTDVNDYTDIFDFALLSGYKAIRVLADGLYGVLARVVVSGTNRPEFIIDLNFYDAGAVQTELFGYTFALSAMAATRRNNGGAYMAIRMPAHAYVGLQVAHTDGVDRTIGQGTFLEVQRLSDVTTTDRGW